MRINIRAMYSALYIVTKLLEVVNKYHSQHRAQNYTWPRLNKYVNLQLNKLNTIKVNLLGLCIIRVKKVEYKM